MDRVHAAAGISRGIEEEQAQDVLGSSICEWELAGIGIWLGTFRHKQAHQAHMGHAEGTAGQESVGPVPLEVRLCFRLSLGVLDLPAHLVLTASVTTGTIYSRWTARPLTLRIPLGCSSSRRLLGKNLLYVHLRHCYCSESLWLRSDESSLRTVAHLFFGVMKRVPGPCRTCSAVLLASCFIIFGTGRRWPPSTWAPPSVSARSCRTWNGARLREPRHLSANHPMPTMTTCGCARPILTTC